MGNVDRASKIFLRKPEVFKDVFQFILQDTGIILNHAIPIDPEMLFSASHIQMPPGNHRSQYVKRQKRVKKAFQLLSYRRDILQNCVCATGDLQDYLLMGIENQSYIDYLMPARVMLYDALTLHMQIELHGAQKKYQTSHEFLTGVPKGTRFKALITVVCYFGTKPWDGPTSLHELYEFQNPALRRLIPDYPIFIIDPHTLENAQLRRFSSALREVFACIKASGNGEDLETLVNSDLRFQHLDPDAAQLIQASLKLDIPTNSYSREVNMCQAIQEIKAKAEKVGYENGEKVGIRKAALNLIHLNVLSYEDISKATQLPLSEIESLAQSNSVQHPV